MDGWTPEAIAALITAIVALLGAIGGVITAWRTHGKVKENAGAIEVHAEKINELEKQTGPQPQIKSGD